MLSPELRKEAEKSKGFIEPTPERDSFLIEQIKELTFKLGSLPPGPEKKAVHECGGYQPGYPRGGPTWTPKQGMGWADDSLEDTSGLFAAQDTS